MWGGCSERKRTGHEKAVQGGVTKHSSLKLFAAYMHICTCFLACKGARAHTNTHMNALPTLTHSLTSGPLVRRFLAFARGRSPSIYYTMERSVNGCNRDACSKKDSRSKKDDSHHCNILLCRMWCVLCALHAIRISFLKYMRSLRYTARLIPRISAILPCTSLQ